MKASLVTGDPYDYVLLKPESMAECVDISRMAASAFPRELDRLQLVHTSNEMELRIRISAIQGKHDAMINVLHDQEN